MSLNAKKAGGNNSNKSFVEQPVLESGTYPVRVVQIIDLGVQPQRPFKGETKPPVHMIQLTYEFTDEFLVDEEGEAQEDKPRWLSEDFPLYNLKSERAKSTKRYYALDPNEDHEGDFSMLLGAPANALVTSYKIKSGPNEGKERNKIQDLSAMRPKDASKTPELVNEPKIFSLEEPDLEIFMSLPEWLQDKIKSNLGYNGSALEEALGGDKPKGEGKPQPKEEEQEDEAEKADRLAAEAAQAETEDEDGDEKPW